jgi:hypothetical protein
MDVVRCSDRESKQFITTHALPPIDDEKLATYIEFASDIKRVSGSEERGEGMEKGY